MPRVLNNKLLYFLPFALLNVFYFLSIRNGFNYSADSYYYIDIATSFATEGKLLTPDGKPLIYWPPLYPLILSVGYPSYQLFIIFFHLFSLNGIVLIWNAIIKPYLNPTYRLVFHFLLCTSTLLVLTAVYVWSEIFFIFLFSLYLLLLKSYFNKEKTTYFLFATVVGFLMLLQRNSGLFIMPFVLLGVMFADKNMKSLFKTWIPHFLVIISGSILWNIKVFWIDNQINVFSELVPRISFFDNFKTTFFHFGKIFVPEIFSRWINIAFYLLILTASLLRIRNGRTESFLNIIFSVLLGYSIIWIIIPGDIYEIDRYISVVAPIAIFFFVIVHQGYLDRISLRYRIMYQGILYLVMIYSIVRTFNNVMLWGDFV